MRRSVFVGAYMKEQLELYVKQVKEWHGQCRNSEQQTKQSLIAPLFVLLGYNMTDPRECKPEYRMDFGKGKKATTPVDWAFLINGALAFFVEAKEAGAKITKYPEQLGMYFSKEPGPKGVKLGILTSGTQWMFFTDLVHDNAMDKEPFFTWDVLKDDPVLALDLMTILQKSKFTPQLIRTFAETKYRQSVLVGVLNRLLAPSSEFVKFAISTKINDAGETMVSGIIKEKVIEQWKPILKDAIHDWVRKQTLTIALQHPNTGAERETTRTGKQPGRGDNTLADLIAAGILHPPLKLFRRYKGTKLEATLLADGAVEFQGQRYDTCSGAAEAARATVSGQKMNTNGWTFWQYQRADGKKFTLRDARNQDLFASNQPRPWPGKKSTLRDQPERYDLRKKFWQALLNRPKMKGTRHADIAPGVFSWIGAGSGVGKLPFVYAIGQGEGRVALYIDRGAGKTVENKDIFDRLHKDKEEIERDFGGPLSWQRLDDKQGCRIAYTLTGGGWKTDESKWPQIQDAMIDAMGRLEKALAPHLGKLKTELTS